jgi:hypothetical protein
MRIVRTTALLMNRAKADKNRVNASCSFQCRTAPLHEWPRGGTISLVLKPSRRKKGGKAKVITYWHRCPEPGYAPGAFLI